MTRAGAAAALLAVAFAVGCSVPLSGDDPLMCNAARFLTESISTTEDALAADAAGRPGEATDLAVQASGFAEGAARTLNEVDEATQADPLWQDLIRAYKHAARAASSLLPAFRELRGTGAVSLRDAREAMEEARLGLPPGCFAGVI
jgi:hypothetical protein